MPIFILFVGIVLIAAGINNKIPVLTGLIKEDFAPSDGSPGFHIWAIGIIIVGALGYYKVLKGFSNGFLILFVLAILLSRKGLIEQFTSALGMKGK